MPYVIIATNRPGIFALQHVDHDPVWPRQGMLRRHRARRAAALFKSWQQAWYAVDRVRWFSYRHPDHWYTRELADFTLAIVRVEAPE